VSKRVRKNARKACRQNLIVRRARTALPGPNAEKSSLGFMVAVYKVITTNLINSRYLLSNQNSFAKKKEGDALLYHFIPSVAPPSNFHRNTA
jgi:hypothetical protein